MHGLGGEEWKKRRHMWPVLPNATTVGPAAESSTSEFTCKDGRKIRVGDCALFKPPQDSLPFIGIIRNITLKTEESPSLGVNWLYRPVDVKLAKGISLEAAPNEIFYSFHKDEIPAASILHPCKVAFLRKGVELPSGISAFVCRRVYDIKNERLWWLTDKNYINERQEEVDQLLDKTRLEMHGTVQSGGRSPKPLNGPTPTPSLKSVAESVQNSSFVGTQVKGKKRERGDQGSDSSKRERLAKTEDVDSGQFRPESMLKSEIAKITEKGGLVDFEGVERLVQLMQPDIADKKIDLAERIMLVDVLSVTERFDCLGWFVQLRGLPVLDEWLQEVHKGKIGDGSMPKESDKSVEEFLLALLRALDKLPVNLHALQTCNVGKSVNHLRTHRNSEIQKKARSLVDTWKRRVEAEMNMNDAKSGWPAKPAPSEVSHVGNRKGGGAVEIAAKNSTTQPSVSKNSQAKLSSVEALSKSSPSPGSSKSVTTSVGSNLKDQNKTLGGAGTPDLPLTPIKEAKSSSSSQSQNNSLSSCREDARSSTAMSLGPMKVAVCSSQSQYNSVSLSPMRIPGSSSRNRKSSNGLHASAANALQKEPSYGKNSGRNSPSGKVSPSQASHEKLPETPINDPGNNQRVVVRLPNASHSPASEASGSAYEDPAIPSGKASPPGDRDDNQERKLKVKTEGLQSDDALNATTDLCDANEALTGYEENNGSQAGDERCRPNEDGDKVAETSNPASSPSGFISRSGQTYDASLSSMNALIESCVKFSEAGASISPGDDVGMNLLATVAAGEISGSENVSPLASPGRKSPMSNELCSGDDRKSKHSGEAVACSAGLSDCVSADEHVNTADPLRFKNIIKHPVTPILRNMSRDGDGISSSCVEKTDDGRPLLNSSSAELLQNAECPSQKPETKDASETKSSAKLEILTEPEGVHQVPQQKESEMHSMLKSCLSSENDKTLVSEGAGASVNIEMEANAKSLELCSNLVNKNQVRVEKVTSLVNSVQKPSTVAESCQSKEASDKVASLPAALSDDMMESKPENADDTKPCVTDHNEGQMDPVSSMPAGINECAEGKLDRKAVLGQSSGSSAHSELLTIPMQGNGVQKKSSCNLDQRESEEGAKEWHASGVSASHTAAASVTDVKLDFDLNEGFSVDDVNQAEIVKQEEPVSSFAVHMPCPMLFPVSSMSAGFHASVTVASAAKGPVVPPENPLRSKGELGWKGSAATSAFRPAERRKSVEQPSNTSEIPSADTAATMQGRPALDFDLNEPDQRSFEDVASQGPSVKTLGSVPRDCGNAGLDLDLNRVDETADAGSFSMSKLDIPPLPNKPSLSGGLSNGGSVSRDFDLNDGPGLDEVGLEAPARGQQIKSSVPFLSAAHGVRPSNAEFGNYSSWFASGNSYSAITVPPLLPGRGDQNFVAGGGVHKIFGPPGSTSFSPEIYRGPVLSSSPAVTYPHTMPFQYPGFPFETNFPLPSNSFSGGSTPFMDSSSAGGLCFPSMPSQLVGPGSVVQSAYPPRPFVMNLQAGTSNVIPESRKWVSQSLDLNSGPGSADSERRDDRLSSGLRPLSAPNSQALMEERMRMMQVAGGPKRKEPDAGWDGADRFSYKQPSWQ